MRGGILALVSLSLVGVGFSSWLIAGKDSPSRDAPLDSIGADGDFIDINKYLQITEVDTSNFVYNPTFGFLAPNDEVKAGYQGSLIFYGFFEVESGFLSDHVSPFLSSLKRNCSLDSSTNAASVFGSCVSEAKLAFGEKDKCDFSNSSYTGTLKNASTGNEVIPFSPSEFSNKQKLSFGVKYTFNSPSSSHGFSNSAISMSISINVEI